MLFSKLVRIKTLLLTALGAENAVVQSNAGIFHGRYLPEFEQDIFLGIKYAPQPPRFAPSTLALDAPH